MIRRLALAIVQRYPAAWRERYEAEVCALIEETPVRLRDLGELVRGLVTERAREVISADDRPKRTAAVLGWMPAVFIILFTAVAAALGLVLRGVTGPWSEAQQDSFGVAIVSFLLVLVIVKLVATIRHARRPHPKPLRPRLPAWIAGLLMPCFFGVMVCAAWGDLLSPASYPGSPPPWLDVLVRGYAYLMVLTDLTYSFWPGRMLLQELQTLDAAEGWLRMNQNWVRSCHEWIAKGVPSPLADAEAQVEHWTRERDKVRERITALGYRSRFRT
jgi:hypothetical protein